MSELAGPKVSSGKLIVISGPSGVGKSTIARRILQHTGAAFSVSATTRKPREGEVNGRDYYFMMRPEFERMMSSGRLLEWAEVFGEFYGTPAEPVMQALRNGRTIILDIDVQGGEQVHRKMPKAMFVLIEPPDMDELAKRLQGRKSEDEASFARRLAKAKEEIKTAHDSGIYKYRIINDCLERAIDEFVSIISDSKEQ